MWLPDSLVRIPGECGRLRNRAFVVAMQWERCGKLERLALDVELAGVAKWEGNGWHGACCGWLNAQLAVVVGSCASGGGSPKNRRQAESHWITVKESEMWVAEIN